MTETVKSDTNNGSEAAKGEMTELDKSIIKQVTYYFGDFNLPRDKFLQEQMKESDGWVSMETMLKFQRLNKLSSDGDLILKALKASNDNLIEVDLENKKIRRNPEVPLPKSEDDAAKKAKSVYVKGFEKTNTSLDDLLKFFNQYENVVHVNRRTWVDHKDGSRNFKGSVFVTFKDKESAEKFMALESVKSPQDEELIKKWQSEYFEEKAKEMEEKRAKKNADRRSKGGAGEDKNDNAEDKDKEEEITLPKGAVVFMKGFKNDTMREDIKGVLKAEFDVSNDTIAFVDFEKGQTEGYIRMMEADAGVNLVKKMKEKLTDDTKLKVKEAEIEFHALEGEEETKYLEKAQADIKLRKERNKGHKRRHGGGGGRGRGGKRGRR